MRRILVLIVLLGVFFIWRIQQTPRFTVALFSDPVVVWFWDGRGNRSVLVSFPSSAIVASAPGYATYSLSSLWKLGDLDPKDSTIFSQSLAETVGISVPWYIGSRGGAGVGVMKDFFSFSGLMKYLSGSYRTNISPFLFTRMALIARTISNSTTVVVDADPALVRTDLPDGSQAQRVDISALDSLIAHEFEDERVRREALPIGVYNTTSIATLGSRFARRLGHMGAIVILVDNSSADVTSVCEIHGRESALKSYTAERITEEFGCTHSREIDDYEEVDLAILLGEAR